MDERFIMHRYRSTRFAIIVCVVMIGVWINYEMFVNDVLRWDLLVILASTALAKVSAMLYYRLTN